VIGRVERPLLENPGEQLLEDADEQAKRRSFVEHWTD